MAVMVRAAGRRKQDWVVGEGTVVSLTLRERHLGGWFIIATNNSHAMLHDQAGLDDRVLRSAGLVVLT